MDGIKVYNCVLKICLKIESTIPKFVKTKIYGFKNS